MHLQELFSPDDLLVGLTASDKWEAIRTLLEHVTAQDEALAARGEEFLEALFERERSMSTGMERGLAIPHAAVDGLEKLYLVMGVVQAEEGVEFASIDGAPTRLVILLLIPREKKLLHIKTLADIARGLGKPGVMEGLMASESRESAWAALVPPA